MTLKDYYNGLDEISPKTKLRDEIIEECGISYDTFYKWMNGSTREIPKTSRERIAQITGISVEELFPTPSLTN